MTTTNTDYSNEVRAMATDLWDLEFQSEANEGNEKWDIVSEFVYTYDIAFPISKLVALGYVDFNSLPEKSLDDISDTWVLAMEKGFFNSTW